MSVTTTATTVGPQTILSTLGDYELHHSRSPAPPPNPRPDLEESLRTPNPPGWPTQYREVPPHRPINPNLDFQLRPGGMNVPEQIFIGVLLNGTALMASVSQLWSRTGQRIFGKNFFRYEIGGEW